jgi:hypothetical protein
MGIDQPASELAQRSASFKMLSRVTGSRIKSITVRDDDRGC